MCGYSILLFDKSCHRVFGSSIRRSVCNFETAVEWTSLALHLHLNSTGLTCCGGTVGQVGAEGGFRLIAPETLAQWLLALIFLYSSSPRVRATYSRRWRSCGHEIDPHALV